MLRSIAPLLIENGYDIKVFNLIEPKNSDGYNPFVYIRKDEDVIKLISNLIQNTVMKIAKAQKILRKAKLALTVMAITMTALTGAIFAADPLSTINSLSDFIFSAIKAIGFILLGCGVVQIGLPLKSHDASQRANGFLIFFGGVIIAFAKDILEMIL